MDKEELSKRSVLDGDAFLPETQSWRFRKPETEPYMPSQAPGLPWFRVSPKLAEDYWVYFETYATSSLASARTKGYAPLLCIEEKLGAFHIWAMCFVQTSLLQRKALPCELSNVTNFRGAFAFNNQVAIL